MLTASGFGLFSPLEPASEKKLAELSMEQLQAAKSNQNYALLIESLYQHVFPRIGASAADKEESDPKDVHTYEKLCAQVASHLEYLIDKDLYARHGHEAAYLKHGAEYIFHFCQARPTTAGKLLNKNIWRATALSEKISQWLIDGGANVNATYQKTSYPSLLYAIRAGCSVEMIKSMIAHGANYDAFQEKRHDVTYTLMLMAALSGDSGVATFFATQFQNELPGALATLNTMVKDGSDHAYSCEFGDYTLYINNLKKTHYTHAELLKAQHLLLEIDLALNPSKMIMDESTEEDDMEVETEPAFKMTR
jgi:hypothetical protein